MTNVTQVNKKIKMLSFLDHLNVRYMMFSSPLLPLLAGAGRECFCVSSVRHVTSVSGRQLKEKYDVVVVGGGHNGLVAAAYLAKAGIKTALFERRHVLGE